ncbi:MAG: terpene cyclase/mutase family protein [Planctomycetes bacterium]|nr:terpene cyclase/mutase family protein [Planctomycetota bacterium]
MPERPADALQQAVPSDDAIAEAVELIRQAYESDYQASDKNPEPLIHKLLSSTSQTDVPARKYACLLEAERVAVKAGDYQRVLELIDIRAVEFEIDGLQMRLDRLGEFLTPAAKRDPAALAKLYGHAIETAESGLQQESMAASKDAADMAVVIARATQLLGRSKKNPDLAEAGEEKLRAAQELVKNIQKRREALAKVEAALAVLKDNPADPVANGTVGRYRCFASGDWEKGLPMLSKADTGELQDMATEEIALSETNPADVRRVFALAGLWWKYAEAPGLSTQEKGAVKKHAGTLYGEIMDRLTDPLEGQVAQTRFASSGASKPKRDDWVVPTPLPGPGPRPDDSLSPVIDKSLEWLIAHQLGDGGWSFEHGQCKRCNGQCDDQGNGKDRSAATALAMIAFHRSGHSHKEGPYKAQLRQGVGYLAALATKDGGRCYGEGGTLYTQGCATIALAEAYALTKDVRLRPAAQAALDYIQNAQDPAGGGWRYAPRQAGDTSATGWQVAALATGRSAGLAVRPNVLANADRFLNSVQSAQGAAYGYTNAGAAPGTTAVGLFCRSKLGWAPKTPALNRGAATFVKAGPSSDLYFDYYATQVTQYVGGETWGAWRTPMHDKLVKAQDQRGHAAGSWYDGVSGGHGANIGGRLYCTTLATMILCVGAP